MARKKRTDNRGRVLRTGESQNKDGRYCFKWTDGTGKRNTTYSVNLAELREKEKQIQRDIEDGINASSANMTLDQLFAIYMESKSNIRESLHFCLDHRTEPVRYDIPPNLENPGRNKSAVSTISFFSFS